MTRSGPCADVERRSITAGLAGPRVAGRTPSRSTRRPLGDSGRLGLQFLADALLDAVYVLGGADTAVPAFAEEARAIYARMGAVTLIDRLDEVLARRPVGGVTRSSAERLGASSPADA